MQPRPNPDAPTIYTRNARLALRPDGIVHNTFNADTDIDRDDAVAAIAAILQLSQGLKMPLLVDMGMVRSVAREARLYFTTADEAQQLAVALLIKSPISQVIGNSMLSMHKNRSPARLFTLEAPAIDWLKTYARTTPKGSDQRQ